MHFSFPALHAPSPFSWQLAMNGALASALAYKDAAEIESTAAAWGFTLVRFFEVRNTQGFVASDDRCVLVSFRGSSQLGNWLSNLDMAREKVAYGAVHRGFLGEFNDARPALMNLLDEVGASDKAVWATGHSLGGALATLMAGELHGRLDLQGLYTFGQPRGVNRRARDFLNGAYGSRFFRFVNDDDVVPKVPPLLQHVGELLWFDKRGELKKAPDGVRSIDFGPEALTEAEFEDFQAMIGGIRSRINKEQEQIENTPIEKMLDESEALAPVTRGILPSVRDHFMDNYIYKIGVKLASSI
jgi:hypothetical protein